MRKVQVTRISGLIGLAVTTSIVTASSASPMKRPVAGAAGPSSKKVFTPKGDQAPRPVPGTDAITTPVSSGHLKDVTVKADGDVLLVSAAAHLQANHQKDEYLWAIRVYDPADAGRTKPLFHWFYTENRWRMDPAGVMVVNFQDAFQLTLPKKRYLVEVSVLLVPPGADVAQLKNPAKADHWQGPGARRPVVVGQ